MDPVRIRRRVCEEQVTLPVTRRGALGSDLGAGGTLRLPSTEGRAGFGRVRPAQGGRAARQSAPRRAEAPRGLLLGLLLRLSRSSCAWQEPQAAWQGRPPLRERGPQIREAVVVGSWCALVRAQVAPGPRVLWPADTCRCARSCAGSPAARAGRARVGLDRGTFSRLPGAALEVPCPAGPGIYICRCDFIFINSRSVFL